MTDKEMSSVLADIEIIVDTREKKNQHILDYFRDNKIPYVVSKLNTADYSFSLPHFPELGLDRRFLVEKKNSLTEIAGNFSKDRARFAREFERIGSEHIHLVIEEATWKKVANKSWRSEFSSNAMMASILTWSIRYNCPIWFCGVTESPKLIYNILRYELFEYLKNMQKVLDNPL